MVVDLFSKRQKRLRGEGPDVFVYDVLPKALRVQMVQIHRAALAMDTSPSDHFGRIVGILRREYGEFELSGAVRHGYRSPDEELFDFLLCESDTERVLDAVELLCWALESIELDWPYRDRTDAVEVADCAIADVNTRFKEHGVGYQYTDGQIVRVDSELVHEEVVKPALRLLAAAHYAGAQQEFLSAHEHYRSGRHKEALNECLKAFESVMKAICDKRRWQYAKSATAKQLIQVCVDSGLFPAFWQQQYSALTTLLESSVPTGRNRLSGHGQGSTPVSVPQHLVAYMLHMTASAIVFLAEAENALP